ncbi:nicotinate-nucleotide diphosphorylase, partial [Haladaptatus sp. NG-SE-30]
MLTDRDVERWLREDVGHHDVTNHVPGETTGRLVARESGVAAGLDAAVAVFDYLDCDASTLVETGSSIEADDTVLEVRGPATDVLRGERVAVNIAGHAAGIATKTAEAVAAARTVSDEVAIAGTRKTT